jgi:uncharacterized protein
MKKIILIVFLSLGFISSAFSSIQDAYDAFDNQDYKTAFEIYLSLAEKGDAKAQEKLSNMYRFGSPKMENSSWKLEGDIDKHLFWAKKAGENGSLDSQNTLAYHYLRERDKTNALYWFNKLIDQGDTWALFKLGRVYEDGSDGFLKSPKKALNYYLMHIDRTSHLSIEEQILANRRGLMNDVASIYENHFNQLDKAFYWNKKAANMDYYWSQRWLGEKYLNGEGVTKSLKDAAYWYRRAYDNPSETAKDESLRYDLKQTWEKHELWKYE